MKIQIVEDRLRAQLRGHVDDACDVEFAESDNQLVAAHGKNRSARSCPIGGHDGAAIRGVDVKNAGRATKASECGVGVLLERGADLLRGFNRFSVEATV